MHWKNTFYRKDTDKEGRIYHNFYFRDTTEAVTAIEGINKSYYGTAKVVLREGESSFGEQMVFMFLFNGQNSKYCGKSKHNTIEWYLPKDKGINFLFEVMEGINLLKQGINLNNLNG